MIFAAMIVNQGAKNVAVGKFPQLGKLIVETCNHHSIKVKPLAHVLNKGLNCIRLRLGVYFKMFL